MSITPLDVASAKRPCEQKPSRKPFRTETPTTPPMFPPGTPSLFGDGAPPRAVINGRVIGRFEMADMRRREVLQRDLDDALRRRALHRRTGNMAAYRKADQQADRYLDLIAVGIAQHRWEH